MTQLMDGNALKQGRRQAIQHSNTAHLSAQDASILCVSSAHSGPKRVRLVALTQVLSKFGTTTEFQAKTQIIVSQSLHANPPDKLGENGLCRFSSFDGGRTTHRTTNNFSSLFPVTRWNQASTIGTMWILILVLLAVLCPPLIHQVFAHQWLPTVCAPRRNAVAVTFKMIGRTLIQLKARTPDRSPAGCTHKMLRMPCSTERIKVIPTDWLATALTDWLH